MSAYLLTHVHLFNLMEHMALTKNLQPTLSWTLLSTYSQVSLILSTSASNCRRNLYSGISLFQWIWGLKDKAMTFCNTNPVNWRKEPSVVYWLDKYILSEYLLLSYEYKGQVCWVGCRWIRLVAKIYKKNWLSNWWVPVDDLTSIVRIYLMSNYSDIQFSYLTSNKQRRRISRFI